MYNIIYSSSEETFMWNGATLEPITNVSFFIAGNVFHKDNVQQEIAKCREVVAEKFPADKHPKIDIAELPQSTH